MTDYDGVVAVLDEKTYHAHPALSSTQARTLLASPARYQWERTHPRVGSSAAFSVGSAVHSLVLGVGDPVVSIDADSWRTAAARTARTEAEASGAIAVLASEYAEIKAMAESVMTHADARALFESPGTSEVSVFATDPSSGVRMRARYDRLPEGGDFAVDLKTTAGDASPDGFSKTVVKYAYHYQSAHYFHAYSLATGVFEQRMKFVVVEKSSPHLVGVYELDRQYADIGAKMVRRALDLHAYYTESKVWPDYSYEEPILSPPQWMIKKWAEL
ncbi:exonuclease [Rathayibacter phage NCPPB3778]|nr:exonuclease [Rathayibacter phage NCPPB3778]